MVKTLLFWVTLLVVYAASPAMAQTPELTSQQETLLEKAHEMGKIPVIVNLNMNYRAPRPGELQLHQMQRAEIIQNREAVLSRQSGMLIENLKEFNNVPHFALITDREGILALLSDPQVADVVLDELTEPFMNVSNEIIGATQVWDLGYTGEGITVAVLDTGVESTHPHFGDRVIEEVCFSSNVEQFGSQSLCPDGASSAIGAGAADDCDMSIQGCGHGTHVAGTVAGSSINSGRQVNGVARDANIISMQVFSRFPQAECGMGATRDCVLSFTSDQIAALNWLYENRNNYTIAAANMSLGGGRFYDACDADRAATKNAMDLLKSVNIATVVASGNNGFKDSISAPACISTAVSVGSSQTGKYGGTTLDAISVFSNSAGILDLLAPGQVIESARPNNSYDGLQGTSMAAPHVAGAWALYIQANPGATVDETLQALQQTGTPLTDSNSITRSRIQLDEAITGSPGAVVSVSDFSLLLGADENESASFTISNAGDGFLNFSITDVPENGAQRSSASRDKLTAESSISPSQRISPNSPLVTSPQRTIANSMKSQPMVFRQSMAEYAGGINGETIQSSCLDRIYPPGWTEPAALALYWWSEESGYVFGTNIYDDIAFGQLFEINEPLVISGAEFLFERAGSSGNVVFTVWDAATKAVLTQTSVALSSLPSGSPGSMANAMYIPFDDEITVEDDVIIGADITQLGSFIPSSYYFGMVSSAHEPDGDGTGAMILESNNQWVSVGTYGLNTRIAIAGCVTPAETEPSFALSYTPVSGSIGESLSVDVTLEINTSGLEPGIYTRTLVITTNDAQNATIEIPVQVTVGNFLSTELSGPNEGWRMLGSPVASTTYGDLLGSIWTQGFPGANAEHGQPNVFYFNQATGSFGVPASADSYIGLSGNGQSDIALGTLVYVFDDDDYDQVPNGWPKAVEVPGTPFSQSFVQQLPNTGDGDGWHLLSNPYPFTLDWNEVFADAQDINANILIWDANRSGGADYLTSGPGGGHSGLIAPFQGFWVQSLSSEASIAFSPSHAAGTDGGLFNEPEQLMVELIAEGNSRSTNQLLVFDEARSEQPFVFNVPRMNTLSTDYLHLYTTDEESNWQTRFMAEEFSDVVEVPLHLRASGSGLFSLSAGMLFLPDHITLWLRDNKTSDMLEITPDMNYEFMVNDDEAGMLRNASGDAITSSLELVAGLQQPEMMQLEESRFTLIIDPNVSTSVSEPELASGFSLNQNYPNPFNPTTLISYTIPEAGEVRLEVFNMLGQRVAVLVNELQQAGRFDVQFDASGFSSGMYLYRLQTGTMVQTRKMVLVK
ncbi:MAG: S8 family peptidase [Balneolia bacterium]|nr:S8 family peptidase [Balneolia bacterium]